MWSSHSRVGTGSRGISWVEWGEAFFYRGRFLIKIEQPTNFSVRGWWVWPCSLLSVLHILYWLHFALADWVYGMFDFFLFFYWGFYKPFKLFRSIHLAAGGWQRWAASTVRGRKSRFGAVFGRSSLIIFFFIYLLVTQRLRGHALSSWLLMKKLSTFFFLPDRSEDPSMCSSIHWGFITRTQQY